MHSGAVVSLSALLVVDEVTSVPLGAALTIKVIPITALVAFLKDTQSRLINLTFSLLNVVDPWGPFMLAVVIEC